MKTTEAESGQGSGASTTDAIKLVDIVSRTLSTSFETYMGRFKHCGVDEQQL